jgi:hypothetical protein
MNRQEIELLISERGAHCISIIIPTDKVAQHTNDKLIRKGVFKAQVILDECAYSEDSKKLLSKKLDQALNTSFPLFSLGLGIFISENHVTKVIFPFPVKERISVGDAFESRDLLYLEQFMKPYFVLSISRNSVRLYSGLMNKFEEINSPGFPMLIKDQYQYEHPSIGSSSSSHLKDFENDKTVTLAIRTKAMLHEANKRLIPIFTNHEIKIIIAGTQKVTSAFLTVTTFRKNIIGFIHGSFSKKNMNLLCQQAWEVFVMNQKAENEKIVQHLLHNGHLIKGLEPAWKATTEGRGLLLAVEKDYRCQGYLIPTINGLFQKKPNEPHQEIPDAVEVLIRTAHEKHLPVYFIDHKELKGLPPITLQTR